MSEKVLVIAEKPSVASDIAKALGGMKREKDNTTLNEENGLLPTYRCFHRFLILSRLKRQKTV